MAGSSTEDSSAAAAPVRVLIADDDPRVRRAISQVVSDDPSLELVALATDAAEAVDLASLTRPDVALVDVRMPEGGGARVAREMRDRSPGTKVLALSASSDGEAVLEMITSGAVGYLVKGANVDLRQGIKAANRGEGVIANEVASQVVGELSVQLARRRDEEESIELKTRRVRQVLDDRGITMVFQSILDLRSGTVAGVEALARFSPDPDEPPTRWFSEAWEVGLGIELELAAVSAALEASPRMPPGLFLAVNVSPATAAHGRFRELLASVEGAGSLVVELTEHAVVEDYDALLGSLKLARSMGVRVAVDDAGAGYASLRHVLRLEPELIKLDVSLVAGIEDDHTKLALASAICSFAHQTGTKVVAEGIESERQLSCVMDLGVDYAQGYHLGRPSPIRRPGLFVA
ncbi:MAG TPA: EAL domain-containing protein [Acidimicrobiales bacterium]|nr:EAL domain-containing protein [Acidimicrobiales bacterium]